MSASNTLLNNKKVLVIGGSSGIGRGVAAAALANGASVVIASSKQAKVEAAVELLKTGIDANTNVTVSGEAFDIGDFKALAEFLKKQAPFDHLAITAGEVPRGLGSSGPDADVDIREQLKDSMDSRYWAALNAGDELVCLSVHILDGGSNIGAAGAIETATRGLALDLKPIRVNTICPGLVDTEMFQQFPEQLRTSMLESYRQKLLVRHVGTPEEVAEAYMFAMKCQYLTGQVITADGGGVLV